MFIKQVELQDWRFRLLVHVRVNTNALRETGTPASSCEARCTRENLYHKQSIQSSSGNSRGKIMQKLIVGVHGGATLALGPPLR